MQKIKIARSLMALTHTPDCRTKQYKNNHKIVKTRKKYRRNKKIIKII